MSLRTLAEMDLGFILSDDVGGFATAIIIIDPMGMEFPFKGLSKDISQTIDPDTGLLVAGKTASVSVRLRDVQAAFLEIPRRITDEASKLWRVVYTDIIGIQRVYTIRYSMPDNELGNLVLVLEAYVP